MTDLLAWKKPIDCKWVYKIKHHADGTIECYKAEQVVKGFTQVEGIDFQETFVPVAKLVSVWCFLVVETTKGWFLHHIDSYNAFLHGDLEKEAYIKLLRSFGSLTIRKMCKLHKSLYDLH